MAYNRETVDALNPLVRFAHRTRVARSLALVNANLPQDGVVVDFGAGTGLLLSSLGDARSDAQLYAIEPYMEPSADTRIRYLRSFSGLPAAADVITAFEVCEHLSDVQLEDLLVGADRHLKPNGTLIVSGSIMVGGALPLKEISRAILHRHIPDYSLAEMIRGTLGGTVTRPVERLATHKGFDFRVLRQHLAERFTIREEMLSPLPLPWWANSQAFFTCAKRA